MQKLLIIGGTGYIGSRLYTDLTQVGFEIDTVDLELRGNFINKNNIKIDYQNLSARALRYYQTIILLAGHSTVKQAKNDPFGALDNNLIKFIGLLNKLDDQKFIYASSSSVYTGVGSVEVNENWNSFNFHNMYDFSKYACDAIAKQLYPNSYALRFGTVCGASENMRYDLMINSMVECGLKTGEINVYNGKVRRPILGINDLSRALQLIIKDDRNPGIYNISSFNTTVSEVACQVAAILNCKIVELPPTESYDFSMENSKIRKILGFEAIETIETIVKSLVAFNRKEK